SQQREDFALTDLQVDTRKRGRPTLVGLRQVPDMENRIVQSPRKMEWRSAIASTHNFLFVRFLTKPGDAAPATSASTDRNDRNFKELIAKHHRSCRSGICARLHVHTPIACAPAPSMR